MDRRIALVLEETENHDQAVKRFRSLCDMHRVPFGEAGNLRGFVTALKQNRHFAMAFWAMVGDLSARERGTLSDDEMLDVLVEGSSGLKISELPLAQKLATAELKNMLAGIDVDSDLLPEVTETSSAEEPDDLAEASPVVSTAELTPSLPTSRAAEDVPVTVETASSRAQTRLSIEDALRRLEETSRELRDQLAAIEQLKRESDLPQTQSPDESAISEEQPAIEEEILEPTPLRPAASDLRAPAVEPSPAPEPAIAPRRSPASKPRFEVEADEPVIFSPPPSSVLSHRGYVPRDLDDDPSIPVPLAEYAESNPRRVGVGTILVVLLLLLAAAAGFALHKGYGRDQLSHARAVFLTKLGFFGEELHDLASPSSSQPASKPQPTTPVAAQTQELQPSQASDSTHNQQAFAAGQQQTNRTAPQEQAPMPPSRSQGVSSNSSGQDLAEREAIRVPASVMEANLVSSRVPVYPEAARAMRIEGTVLVDAVISRTGAVNYARAISGDPRLRAAAEEAVMKWRYKPYLLNGTPVEAATQVRVTFRLP